MAVSMKQCSLDVLLIRALLPYHFGVLIGPLMNPGVAACVWGALGVAFKEAFWGIQGRIRATSPLLRATTRDPSNLELEGLGRGGARLLGGSWDLVIDNSWAHNPTCNWGNLCSATLEEL